LPKKYGFADWHTIYDDAKNAKFNFVVAATPDGKSPTLEACDRIGIKNSTILVSLHACRY
jgi:hypothetical protein